MKCLLFSNLFHQSGMVVKLTKGDTCIFCGGDNDEEESIMEITLVGGVADHYFTIIDGKYYIPGFLQGHVVKHTWTLTPKFLPRTYKRASV